MDGRHDYSSLDRGRLFHHPHPGHPGHPPGPTPPPPPLLSPVGFPETGGGLGSGLARQSLVELARVNAATPGGPLGSCPPLPGGPAGYPRSYHMPGSLSLHSPRSGYQSSLMSPFLSGGAGAGAGGSGTGGGSGGSGAGPSSTSVGAGPSAEAAAAYKSMLSASTPGLPPHYWPPPPPSPHTTPPAEGLGRHSLTGSLYPGYMSLLPGADNMALYSAASTSPMSQSMHAYHRIYDLHKEAYLPGVPGLVTSSSSVSSVTDNPLFAYPHSSCSAACFTSGCSRVSSMSATLELQEQARALHFHLQQQHLHAKLQEEQERGDWEWHREREREREEREREERGREERDREERDRERVGREREREKEKERERDDRERENREKQRERESPTTRPRSSSDGASSRRHKKSPPGGRTVKTEGGGTVVVEKDPHHHSPHHHPHPHHHHHQQQQQQQQHEKQRDNNESSPDVGVVSPNKSKGLINPRVAEVSGLPRQLAASPGGGTLEEKDDIVSSKHKARGKVSVKVPEDKNKDTKGGSNSEGGGDAITTSDNQRLDPGGVQHRDDASSVVPLNQNSKGTGDVKEAPRESDSVAVDKVKVEPHQQPPAVSEGDKVTTVLQQQQQQQQQEKEHVNVVDLKGKKAEASRAHMEECEGQSSSSSSTVQEATRTTHPQHPCVGGASTPVQQPATPGPLQQKVTEQSKPPTTSTLSPTSSPTTVTTTSSVANSAVVTKPSLRSTPQSLVCLKKQLTENIPSDIILGGSRSQRLESMTSSTGKTTSRHDPPRPVLTSALQPTRRLLHSPEGVVTTSSTALVTSPLVTATTSLAQSNRHAVTTTTTTMAVPKMTSNVAVVTSSSIEGSVYTVCSSTKSMSLVCVPTGVNVSSGESSSVTTRVSSSHRSLGTLYSYSHVSGNGMPESGPRKVHATTFTPEVGTVVHQGPITSPVSCSNTNSNSSNSSTASTSPTHGGESHKRTGERGHGKTQQAVNIDSIQDSNRAPGRPCLSTAAETIIKSGQVSSVPQHLQTVKQRLGHGKKKEENKSFCRLQQTASSHTTAPSVLSKGPLSSSNIVDKDLRMRLGHIEHGANSERTEHVQEHGKPDKTGTTSNSEEVNSKGSDHHRMHHSKGHLGTLQRLTGATAKEDQWHGHWSSSRELPHTRTASGDGFDMDAAIGSIVPKEETIEEESTTSSSNSNKQVASSSVSRKRQQHQGEQHLLHGATSSHKWTSLGHPDPSSKGGYGTMSKHPRGILSPGGSAEQEVSLSEHSGGMSHILDSVVKEEGPTSDTPVPGRGLERAAHGRGGEGVGSHLHQQHHEQHHPSADPYLPHHRQHPPAPYLLSPLMPAAAEGAVLPPGGHIGRVGRPPRSDPHEQGPPHGAANDVKPVLVGDTHSTRLVPVNPQRHPVPEVKEGNQNEDTPATSGSNIPVGIAIARKRGDKRHTQVKSDEGGPTNTEAASERVRHREGAEAEPSRGPARDNTNTSAKPSTDIGPNLVVTGGASRTWREGEEPSASPATHSGVGAWLPPGPHPQLGPPMWLGQGGFPIPPTVDPAQLSVPPPGGLKLAQDPLTGQVYVIPDVPLEAGRVWPASGFTPGSLQGQQLQFLQQQYVQQLQHLQQQQQQPQGGPTGGSRPPEAVKTEAPCRQEEKAGGPQYQQLQRQAKSDAAANMGSASSEASRAAHPHFKTSPPTQAPSGDAAENQGAPAGPLLPPGEGGQNQGGPHPFLVGLGQTFPGLPYPPHLPYYLDPALLQQLRTGAAPAPLPPAVSTETTSTSRADPVTVMSRGCSPIVFPPDDVDDEVSATSQAITTVSTASGPSEVPTRSTVGSQTSRSPVLELLRMYSKEEGTQTSGSQVPESYPTTSKVEVGVQLTPPMDSDSDSNCALTMPHLTARTIDCGTQADDLDRGGMTYSSRFMSGHYYDSDRRSASPPPPALVAEGSPRHLSDTAAPPNLTQQQTYNSDSEGLFNMSSYGMAGGNSSISSSCLNTPTPRGKGIFDLDLEFLNRQILEASDGLELLSTLAERAQREQQEKSAPVTADEDEDDGDSEGEDNPIEGRRPVIVTTDTDDDVDVETDINRNYNDDVDTDINRNYNVPKASMFMEGPSMYSFSSKFASPTTKKDTSRLSSTFSYTEEQVDASQIEMRMKLNDLQRKYKEKQRQLAKLQPRQAREEERHLIKRGPGRPRKRRFKKSSSKSESPSKSPRSESSERISLSTATEQQSPKKKKKDSSSCSKSSTFSVTPSKSKSKSSDSKGSSSKRPDGSSSRSDKSSSKKKSSLSAGSSSGSKSSKSGSSKNKSSSSGSKSQSKKKDGKSSQKKTKVKKEERDFDLEDSELEDVSWLFDEDEINPPPTVFAPTPVKKPAAKPMTQSEPNRSQQASASASHERHGADHHASPATTSLAAASRSPYSFTESYDETSDEGSLGLLARFASSNDWRCSVAAATSAALKSKKRKKRPGGFGDLNDAPVKKRKPGRPKKFEHELETGMTETIVDKKSKSLSLLHINTNTTTSSSGAISSSSSSSSSSSGSSSAGPSQPAENSPKKKVKTNNNKEQKPVKNETSVPFLEEEWCLRRSERIFLSDPNLNSPPLPTDAADKSLSQKKLDTDSSGSTCTTPSLTSSKISRPAKAPTPVTTPPTASTTSGTPTTSAPSGGSGGAGSSAALKAKSSSKLKAKVKTMHDLSQKVKKKYKKPLKPSLVKAVQSTTKSEPLEALSNVNETATTNSKPGASSSKINTSSKLNANSSKVTGSNSKVSGSSSKVSSGNPKVKYDQVYTDSDSDSETSSDGDNVPLSAYIERSTTPEPRSCVISKDDLRGGLRVLIYMDGLFYEGQVKAIEPPDVYGVVIDGERGSRPHILSQEELLNEAVLDVQPASTRCLVEGTRVCAYWSQQFSCLYPGTVARSSPNPATDKHLVSVEFDDGDSGRIPIEHIRMLPHDYPVVTVGPSPILVLSKRRRRTASEELMMTEGRDRKLPAQPTEPPSTTFQSPDEPKQRRRLAKSVGIRRQEEQQGMPTISETNSKQAALEPIDEYDPLREFGPDIPPQVPPEQCKEKEATKDTELSSSVSLPLPPPQSTTTTVKKKHKHKEKKKERDKERAAKRSNSSGGDDHKHKHHHHHHHHHHHKKHKHRKSSTDSTGGGSSKSTPTTPVVGASTVKGSFLSQPSAAIAEPIANLNNSINSSETPASLGASHKAMSELSINTSISGNMMVTATSPGNNGDKKLTMRIRTNSTDTHPLSPKHGVTNDSSHTPTKAGEKLTAGTSTEKSQSERTARAYQVSNNYSEDDSPDTSSEDDDDDDSDFLDSKGPSKKKQKSSMSSAGNKGRQTKRQTSVENKSKMAAFLPARQLWRWLGTSTRRPGMKGKAKKEFYKAITRGKEVIRVGDCAVFLSTGRPHLPYVGRIESLWEAWGGNMVVKVKWFYHPEETKGGKKLLEIKGALYQSPHVDENDVQTISHKCEVMRYTDYKARSSGGRRVTDYDNEDVYYLAGTYEPTVGMITLEDDVKLLSDAKS